VKHATPATAHISHRLQAAICHRGIGNLSQMSTYPMLGSRMLVTIIGYLSRNCVPRTPHQSLRRYHYLATTSSLHYPRLIPRWVCHPVSA
jgi:hypothetical protein